MWKEVERERGYDDNDAADDGGDDSDDERKIEVKATNINIWVLCREPWYILHYSYLLS